MRDVREMFSQCCSAITGFSSGGSKLSSVPIPPETINNSLSHSSCGEQCSHRSLAGSTGKQQPNCHWLLLHSWSYPAPSGLQEFLKGCGQRRIALFCTVLLILFLQKRPISCCKGWDSQSHKQLLVSKEQQKNQAISLLGQKQTALPPSALQCCANVCLMQGNGCIRKQNSKGACLS